ncbi:Type I inositol 1,4,5-trisphosphate 5-phosphatase CVP2 [Hibiscus syriacus]|uniref:Type I inositol 1,4,5-trisphosphate 5-phosphatase CVP2 n=1 Tax=Hibiscus syriacus TaxID=106335 RepID=A0A6A3C9X8_HIBSY|nr:type I inositol polyphosphate 5-phosphatase 10-like [Hibiscus syriacus]KAE8724318.1 Type I inositol 1,4,5-trisphosphate 5-phosphatase CVP2 [Hibiscus syriacus]
MIGVGFSGMTLMNQDRTNQQASSLIGKILSVKGRNQRNKEIEVRFGSSEGQYDLPLQPLLSRGESTKAANENLSFRVFVATWNVGGKSPDSKLNLDDILKVREEDIYVLGFQEIVPLNAGNVLVIEDNEPAVKWLALINQSLNKANHVPLRGSKSISSPRGSLVFPKTSLRKASKALRTEDKRRLKSCNCLRCPQSQTNENDNSSEDDEDGCSNFSVGPMPTPGANSMKYGLVASKQMVGIFLTVWMRKELVQYVSHMRISCVGRGILGCLGNKGCISVSMLFHKTSFCFLCSHLASGEKEGDELRRNSDVIEILRNTQFPRICKTTNSRVPEKILDHDRVIWLGDLNYRISLSYSDTGKLLKQKAWDALYNNDQLKIVREAGRVFNGWKEGKIYFAPTYKYSLNSDIYAGETIETKSKRRTPAWCDRILWRGSEMYQLSYERKELRFSDHRPVCSRFWVGVEAMEDGSKKR